MIITKKEPFTAAEIKKAVEEFETYIKTVIDIDQEIGSAGANRHFESERLLLDQGSKQSSLWGGGIDLDTLIIDNNSIINIRPSDDNNSNEIQDPIKRKKFEELSKCFFQNLWKK